MDTNESFGAYLKRRLFEAGLVDKDDKFEGCTPDQIEEIREMQKVRHLPKIYYEFMLEMGREAGTLFHQKSYTYPYVGENKEFLLEDLEEELFKLPDDAFVFLQYGGYLYHFFVIKDTEEDPAVFEYRVTNPEATKVADRLSEYFELSIEAVKQMRPKR